MSLEDADIPFVLIFVDARRLCFSSNSLGILFSDLSYESSVLLVELSTDCSSGRSQLRKVEETLTSSESFSLSVFSLSSFGECEFLFLLGSFYLKVSP